MLQLDNLSGMTFLDVGSGSGLFSLAAYNLGAKVVSFDFDAQSVWCTNQLRERFCSDKRRWTVKIGSILEADFIKTLGHFDIVYSWEYYITQVTSGKP